MKKWNNLDSKKPLDLEWYLCSDGTMIKVLMWSDEADSFICEGYKYDRFVWFMNLPELPE